jgi:prepilin-type N-terminal cleavage/methylation domain-containing protein
MIARHDRGFSLIEAMVASVIMLIGLLGLAGLQIVGMRANHLGKRMSQASLLAQDLVQNMETIWQYTDPRLTPVNNCAMGSPCTNTNSSAIAAYWDTGRGASPSTVFDYTDSADSTGASNISQLNANYEGVMSPVDTTLAAGEQTIFSRYWNVFAIDINGSGTAQGKLVQVAVRWKEPVLGYRQVTTSFFKYDPTLFGGP